MVKKKSKLLAALDAHKGRDYEAERQKKLQKLAEKRKRLKATKETSEEEYDEKNENTASSAVNGLNSEVRTESEGWESDESEAAEGATVGFQFALKRVFGSQNQIEVSGILSDESDSDSSIDAPNGAPLNGTPPDDEAIEMTENAGDIGTEDVPFSDIESLNSEEKADVLPYQRLTINNTTALLKAHKSIALPYTTLPFSAHQVVTTSEPVSIPDVHDDLNRELAFYKQCLSAAESGRAALKKEGVPFTRPPDYFAEMVKSEDQMGRVKQKIVDQAASKKAASEARRQRDLRKFGKQVQVAKLQERSKAKRAALEKIEVLKRSQLIPFVSSKFPNHVQDFSFPHNSLFTRQFPLNC